MDTSHFTIITLLYAEDVVRKNETFLLKAKDSQEIYLYIVATAWYG